MEAAFEVQKLFINLKVIKMEYSFSAELSAGIEISDSDFQLLLDCSSHHYDHTVQSMSMIGGFLYGHKNCREFTNGEDKTLWVTQRKLGLMMKSLEMCQVPAGLFLSSSLWKVAMSLQNEMEKINNSFTKLNV